MTIDEAVSLIQDAAHDAGYRTWRAPCRTESAYITCWRGERRFTIRIGLNHGRRKNVNRYVDPTNIKTVEAALNYLQRRVKQPS